MAVDMKLFVILFAVATLRSVHSRALEDSVVSVYTTQPTTAGTHAPLDVYHQIASNIAERITSPIYRFLGIGNNRTEEEKTTRRSWENIELLDEVPEEVTDPNFSPVDNDISDDRDVEELLVDGLKKKDRKPEKITLYSSYLPVVGKLELVDDNNDTATEGPRKTDDDDDDDGLTLDDVESEPRDGYFIYFLELIGSFVQLVIGGLSALFKPKASS